MRIIVIGAGISGLAIAYRIQSALPIADLTVLETSPRPGGNIATVERDGFRVEIGPNGFLDSKPGTLQLCRDLGLGDQLVAASEGSRKNRFLCLNGRLVKLPGSPFGLLTTRALSWRGKLALLREPWRKRPADLPADETVAAFARRRFGTETADTIIDALVTGIHGGNPERLSVAAAFPRLPLFEAQAGSVLRGFRRAAKAKKLAAIARGEPPPGPPRMWSFPGGLQTLTDALAARLGPQLHCGASVSSIETTASKWTIRGSGTESWLADAVVLTTPAHRQADIVAGLDPDMAKELNGITSSPIAVVALGYKATDAPTPDGFGYIAPQNTRRDVLGVQWCSSIFPGRAPPGCVLWRALCGGSSRPDAAEGDDETLIQRVHTEMKHVMKVTGEPVFAHVHRWPRAIPQYVVGHRERVARIDARAAKYPGLFLGGNAYHGIAMNDCTERAEVIANAVCNYLTRADRQ